MVQMMEKYADNLEELVAEKTVQLMDEKRKTDALLESILPRYDTVTLFLGCARDPWEDLS